MSQPQPPPPAVPAINHAGSTRALLTSDCGSALALSVRHLPWLVHTSLSLPPSLARVALVVGLIVSIFFASYRSSRRTGGAPVAQVSILLHYREDVHAASHQLAKRKNWAAREPGVVLVFCIIFAIAVGVLSTYLYRRMQRRKAAAGTA
ncbi:hypothetical protein HL42_3735 [Trichophyton rubrum]|nr:hypothetical protein HL42_3735 [Trichophyton rubrum]